MTTMTTMRPTTATSAPTTHAGAAGGVFNPTARAAILQVGDGRCIGCGRVDVTCQHRRARGMGGTDNLALGHPANGVPLCGSGTTGCHGWVEAHPRMARLLGYALEPGESALDAPFFDRTYGGWRRWTVDLLVEYVDETELDNDAERYLALATFKAARNA